MNIYLPRACATLLRPSATAAPNTLQLKFPRHFSKIDIRSYLKAVYEVDVANVGYTNEGSDAINTRMVHPRQVEVKRRGHMHIHPSKQLVRWTSSFKLAYVTVAGIFRHPLQGKMRLTDLYKERRAERRLARRERARAVLREHWPRIIRERLRFSPIKPNALAHPCGKRTATPLKNLKLDADCVVKRNVERRVRPETIKVPRKYLVAKKMRLRGAELGAKRRMMERKEVTAVGKLLKQFELLQVRDASAAPITASMTAKA